MKAVLLDTHAWASSLSDDDRLSPAALEAIERAETIYVSPVSFFEIGQMVRQGFWPEMEPYVHQMASILEEQGGMVAALEPSICVDAAMLDWAHRDPFDRLIAATAKYYALPLISADTVFDGKVPRVW
ncbi:MAG TPA: type II toxin-antitoxin system VapC family toxin [Magnetospirillaceae bacterium]|nr:type II toxin-antitoxin system VapC family toxin [Magnetospirillaceae bacterium]